MHAQLKSPALLGRSSPTLVSLEESAYRAGHKNNYFADRFGIDVLTDTTERSPTYCTPPFRKFDDTTATESWSFLFVPYADDARRLGADHQAPADVRRVDRGGGPRAGHRGQGDAHLEIVRKISAAS